jgi:putative ABC transport system permease protein
MARREARRAKGRAALVVAMIALPVAALAFGAIMYDTFTLSPQEEADRQMGAAQAAIVWPNNGHVQQDPAKHQIRTSIDIPKTGSSKPPPDPSMDRLRAILPPGSRVITDQAGKLTVRTASGIGTVNARLLDYAAPLARGVLRPLSGSAPATADEVALTPKAARRLGVGIGGTVRLADGSRTFRVVGLVEDPKRLDATTIILRPGALPPTAVSANPRDLTYLAATPGPVTWAMVKQLNSYGMEVLSRYVLANPPSSAEIDIEDDGESPLGIVLLVGGLAMLEIILLAGPAFAVGARRRRRELALVAASGGTPAQVRRIVLADGVVLGAVAAVVGVALGIAVATVSRPLIETLSSTRSGGFRLYPEALAAFAGLAVVTGVLAAVVPAWISSRQDVVTALAGRRGIIRSRRRWIALGGALFAVGAALAAVGALRVNSTVILAGLVVAELGLVLCTPAFVGLVARIGHRLPLAPRIALRDTSRNRTAAAPAISAVMAAVVGSLAASVVLVATNERNRATHPTANRPGDVALLSLESGPKAGPGPQRGVDPQAVAALRSVMPVAQVAEIRMPSCDDTVCFVRAKVPAARECPYAPDLLQREPTAAEQRAARRDPRCDDAGDYYLYFGAIQSPRGVAVVVDEAAAVIAADVPAEDADEVAAALRAGAVVVDRPLYLENGRVTLAVEKFDPSRRSPATVSAPGFVLPHPPRAPIAMMTETTARSLGLSSTPLATLARTSRMPTVEEEDRLKAAVGNDIQVYVERGARSDQTPLVVLAVIAGVITLGAAAIATGLAAADSRADLGTLAAVGASPRVRRSLSLSQAGVIAGLGSLLGVVAGLGASTAVLAALNRTSVNIWPAPAAYPITVPWLNVVVALVLVPLIAMLGAGLLTRSRLPIERRL